MQPVSFIDAVKLFFTRYIDFKGRSRRSEYWWANLFCLIVSFVLAMIIPDFVGLWSLAILVPSYAILVRRLHDVGKSAWFLLWYLLPFAGAIIIFIQLLKDSTEDNQWGTNPKA